MGGLFFIGCILGIGCLLGWVAFLMVLSARNEISELTRRLNLLEGGRDEAAQPSAAVQSAAGNDQPADRPEESAAAPEETFAPAPEPEIETAPPWSAAAIANAAPIHEAAGETAGAETRGRGIEASLAGDWMVWIGGAALVLGGAFLVKSAVDAGFFGPGMRILSALIAGAAMIAAAQWLKNEGDLGPSLAPPVLAGAGGATIYGAIFAAYGLYELLPPVLAFILLVAASAGMVVLAVIHRAPAMAWLALVGAHLSPVITGDGSDAASVLLLYVFGVSLAGLAAARVMRWRSVAYLALAGGFLWPALIMLSGISAANALPLAIYLPAFLAMAAFVAWDHAGEPVLSASVAESASVSVLAFYIAAVGALFLAFIFTLSEELGFLSVWIWAAFGGGALFLAWSKEGFAVAPAMGAAATAAVFALADGAPGFPIVGAGAAFAALYGATGYAILVRREMSAPLAVASAFGPVAILAALFYAVGSLQQALGWGAAAVVVAISHMTALGHMARRPGGFDASPGAVSAYALAASLASMLAVAMSAEGLAMSVGFALQAPVVAWLWRRFGLEALKLSAIALGALSTARLLFFPETLVENVGSLPVFNWLVPAYLLPAGGFWLAARWFEGGGAARNRVVVQAMEAAAIALFAAFVGLQIRHLLNGGDLDAPYSSLLEISLQTMSWAGIAAFMRWRFGSDLTFVRSWAEKALLALAAAQTLWAPLTTQNPWWGETAPEITGPPVFNMLLLYFLGPAVAFAAAAYFCHRAGSRLMARIAALFAAFVSYVWLLLEVRRLFHAPDLSAGVIGDGESWMYSLAAIVYATIVLVLGAMRRSAIFRYAGLGALLLAVAKVFLLDMASLSGLLRATSFLGLGAALVGVAALYQRVLSPMIAQERQSAE